MALAPHECLSSVPSPPKPSLPANSCGFGILSSPRPAANAVRKIISRPPASLNVALIASGPTAKPTDKPAEKEKSYSGAAKT